jgi:polysaccharide biosynthesis/export protein
MNAVKILCALTLLMTLIILPSAAQQQTGQSQPFITTGDGTRSAMSPGGADAVTTSSKDYPLGPGDVIELRVFGETQFDGLYQVDSDGNVTIPFIEQPINVRCRTVKDLRKDVTTALAKFLVNPQVYMGLRQQNSRPAAVVFGAVRFPHQFEMHRRARLLELISTSGGVTEQANGTIQITHREEAVCPEPDELTESKSAVQGTDASGLVPFSIYKVSDLKNGKPEGNPFIRPGDIVYVAEAAPVYLTGAVNSPGGVYLREHLTLTRAIAIVGGLSKEAKTGEVRVYRQKEGGVDSKPILVDFRKIQRHEQPDIELQPYDVIEVPLKGFNVKTWLLGFAQSGAGSVITNGAARVILY